MQKVGINNKTDCNGTLSCGKIKSENSVSSPNFKGYKICGVNADTVEINNKNSNKIIKSMLGIIGTGAVVGAAVISFIMLRKPDKAGKILKSKFKNINQIRKYFSQIFGKDFSEEKAAELATKYKRICKIKDDEKFVKKLFSQLKKDYGFKNSHIKLKIRDYTSANAPNWMATHSPYGHLVTLSRVDKKFADRISMFDTLFHELKHHKQFEIAVATDRLAYEKAVACMKIKGYTQEQIERNGGRNAVLEWLQEQGRVFMQPEIDRIEREIGQIPKDSPLYKKGLAYIRAKRNYIQGQDILSKNSKYKNNILEKEADLVGDLARKLFGLIK